MISDVSFETRLNLLQASRWVSSEGEYADRVETLATDFGVANDPLGALISLVEVAKETIHCSGHRGRLAFILAGRIHTLASPQDRRDGFVAVTGLVNGIRAEPWPQILDEYALPTALRALQLKDRIECYDIAFDEWLYSPRAFAVWLLRLPEPYHTPRLTSLLERATKFISTKSQRNSIISELKYYSGHVSPLRQVINWLLQKFSQCLFGDPCPDKSPHEFDGICENSRSYTRLVSRIEKPG